MTVFVDATTAEHARGIGTVIERVTDAMLAAAMDVVVAVGPRFAAAPTDKIHTVSLARSRIGRLAYQRLLLPLDVARLGRNTEPIDRILLLDAYLPHIRRRRTDGYGVLVHDVLPLTHGHFWPPGKLTVKRAAFSALHRSHATIFTSTSHNAREIERLLDVQTRVVRFGCGQLTDAEADAARTGPLPQPEPYFIAVGTFERRKNLLSLITSFEAMARELPGYTLRLVGRGQDSEERTLRLRISESPVAERIQIHPRPDRRATIGLIARATALVMPSLAEGFGLPILEASALGTPVIASDLPAIRAWAGDSIRYASATEPATWLSPMLESIGEAEEARRASQGFASSFRWLPCAASLLDW